MGAKVHLRLILFLLPVLLSTVLVPSATAAPPALLWQRTWGGGGYDIGSGVVVDSSNNIYVTGCIDCFGRGNSANSSLTLLKYDEAGSQLWQRKWSGSGNGSDAGVGLVIDSSGSIYVTGSTSSFGAGGQDALLLKFDSSGNLLLQKTWGGCCDDGGSAVALDSSGNIYVTGNAASFAEGKTCLAPPNAPPPSDIFLLKFNSTGAVQWQKTWGTSVSDYGSGVVVDASGNVYVAAISYDCGAELGRYLFKFNSMGGLLWQKTFGGVVADYGWSLALDPSGNIYIAGYTGEPKGLLLKIDSSGNLLWARTWGNGWQYSGGVAVAPSGNIYVTGSTILLKFSSTGALISQSFWSGGFGGGIAVDSSGNALITGGVFGPPPYTLSPGNNTIATANVTVKASNFTLYTPTFPTRTPLGILGTPQGNQSYAGGMDQFLIKLKPSNAIPLTSVAVLLAVLATPTVSLIVRRHMGGRFS